MDFRANCWGEIVSDYGHLFPGAEADAVARMREAFIQPARLTGTSDHPQQFQQHSGREGVRQGAKGRHSEALQIDRFGHEKTLVSQRFTEKNQGLGAMRALGLEPRTQGLKVRAKNSKKPTFSLGIPCLMAIRSR